MTEMGAVRNWRLSCSRHHDEDAVCVCHHCGVPLGENALKRPQMSGCLPVFIVPRDTTSAAFRKEVEERKFCVVPLEDPEFEGDRAYHCLDCAKRFHGNGGLAFAQLIAG